MTGIPEKLSAQGVRIGASIPMAGARKMLAEHMVRSHSSIPAVTVMEEWDVQALADIKARFATSGDTDSPQVSYTHILIKMVARALREHPFLNATLAGDEIQLLEEINIGMAVALPDGSLVVPVIREADRKDIGAIAGEAQELTERARAGKLRLTDVRGATFTLTNVGIVANSRWQTPLVPYSQCAILATGAIREAAVVRGGSLAVGRVMSASLTFDHRIVSGLPANLFMRSVAGLLAGGL
ncbi:MAG TPA: 2-oxo acid dehydrogenase subunit E2 [Steroidobacteraceae bacterium]|nr:2-oxo acid dehydrogenase subunit E2 [Steroidobacteraceae bacterium]